MSTTFERIDFDFSKYKAFFAFGQGQFDEAKKRLGIGEDEKIVSLGNGLYALKSNYQEMWDAFSLHNEEQSKLEKAFYNEKKWEEITEEQFYDFLEVLPPEEFTKFENGCIFRMEEYWSGNVTNHIKKKDGKYYTKKVDTTSYKNIAEIF